MSRPSKSGVFIGVFATQEIWRRGWDSNPRYGFPHARFRGECFQPLSHLSAVVVGLIVAERYVFRQSSPRFVPRRSKQAKARAYTNSKLGPTDWRASDVPRRRTGG